VQLESSQSADVSTRLGLGIVVGKNDSRSETADRLSGTQIDPVFKDDAYSTRQ